MTVVRCPRCRDEVTAPANAAPKALVRCPFCLEEYLLSEALAGVPPALIVVGGDVSDEAHGDGGEEYRVAGSGFAGVFDTSAPAEAAAIPARPSLTSVPRPKKPEKSAAVELMKIVLGGVLGLAIGMVVLWWGFRRDPLNVGPDVANYAPWLVPVQFHRKSKSADSEAAALPKRSQNSGKRRPTDEPSLADAGSDMERLPISAEPAGFDSGLFDPLAGGGKGGKLPEPNLDIPLELPKPAGANLDLPPLDFPPTATKIEPADSAPEIKPAPPMPDLTDLLPDSTPPAELGPADAKPVPSAAAFAQAVAAAIDALALYEGLPRDDAEARRAAFTKLHQATGEVGRVISHLNPMDAELSEDIARLQDLLDTISGAKGSSKLNPVKFLAEQQWPKARQDDGLLVAGTVTGIQPAGRLFEITLDAKSQDVLTLPILTATNPDELCAVGDILVAIGRVQDDPHKHLPGYEGERSRVLLLGHAVRAPKLE